MRQQKNVSNLVFIASNVEDYQSLISGISPNAEVMILDETLDGIEQITERLASEQNIEAIHIISHGSPGAVHLGVNTLNSSNIESFGPQLKQWRKALTNGADILLYGCNVAADVSVKIDSPDIPHIPHIPHIRQGLKPLSHSLSRLKPTEDNSFIQSSIEDFRDRTGVKTPAGTGVKPTKPNQFLQRLNELTGADIAASANLTGNAALGGNWELEVQTGLIETPIPFNANALTTYSGLLGFAPKVDFLTGSAPYSVSIGDFNGDGFLDLAVANFNSGSASILLNTTPIGATTPTFAPQVTFPSGALPSDLSIGDFNGDGKPDLAVANDNSSGSASILLNTTAPGATTPSFATQVSFPAGSYPREVSIGDFNGDGRLDLAVANSNSNSVSILLNTTPTNAATPTFAPKVDFYSGISPRSVSIGDINGDGLPDLAVANFNSNTASILLNTTPTNATTPSFATQVSFPNTYPQSISTGDFNGDGFLDLATANSVSNTASILLNTTPTNAATPTFAPKVDFATDSAPYSVSIGDFNGDGFLDLATANRNSNTASILLNTTPTGATTPTFAPNLDLTTGTTALSVSIGDINGDGKPDLAVANRSSNNASILLNTTPKVTAVTATTADGSYKAGDTIAITVTFDAAVNVDTTGGTPQLQLETGTTDRFATYASGSGGTVLTFNYVVQAGDTSNDLEYLATTALTLNGGTIKETVGTAFDAFLTLPTLASANSLGGSKAIVIDTLAPTIASVTSTTTDGSYNTTGNINVTVNFSEAVTLAGGNMSVALDTGGTVTIAPFTGTSAGGIYTPAAGQNSLDLNSNSITLATGATLKDTAGNDATLTIPAGQSLADSRAIIVDTILPTVALTSTSATTVKAPFSVTATFSENVTGFDNTDITLANANVSNFVTLDAKTYTFDVTPSADGPVTVDVPAAKATDTASNNNTAATGLVRTADITPPTVALTSTSATTINAPFLVTATFSENVTGFSATGINVTNGTVSGFTGSGTTYNFTVTPNADGNVTVDVPAATATDTASNNNIAATQLVRTADITPPTVALTSTSATTINAP
ncbi:FG-GAP-like repeat-containing protein, partial [Microcoleus sp. F8_C2]